MELEMHNDVNLAMKICKCSSDSNDLHGGTVYAVEPKEVPDDTPVAAVFRY